MLYATGAGQLRFYGRLESTATATFFESRMHTDILDNKTAAGSIDRQDMLHILEETPEAYEQAYRAALKSDTLPRILPHAPDHLALVGIGGSAIAADIIRDWLYESETAIEVIRGSKLPGSVTKSTYVLACSYSGQTAETLEALKRVRQRKSRVACVASGGKLIDICEAKRIPHVQIKAGLQPRAALPHLFSASAAILGRWKICSSRMIYSELKEAAKELASLKETIGFDRPLAENPAKQLAIQLIGTFPIVYSPQFLSAAGRRFKNQLNENSKVLAKSENMPEMLHNEVQGWRVLKEVAFADSLSFVLLKGGEEQDEVAQLSRLSDLIRESGGRGLHEISLKSNSRLVSVLSAIYYCDYVSYYLALARGVDPTPVETISALKRSLTQWTT